MGNLHICSPSKQTPSKTKLKQRNTESTTSSVADEALDMMEEEKIILNNMVLDLTRQLAAQQMQNRLLKQELNTVNEQNKQNIEVLGTFQHHQTPSILPNNDLFADAGHARYSSTVIHSDLPIKKVAFNEHNIANNAHTPATVNNVMALVNTVYKSSHCILSDESDEDHPELDYDESSYMDEEEQAKINEAKALLMKKQSAADELVAMQHQLNAMGHMATDDEISKNLFRFESNQKWDSKAIAQKKKEMKTAMTHHIVEQLKKSNNVADHLDLSETIMVEDYNVNGSY
eukprot:181236_1